MSEKDEIGIKPFDILELFFTKANNDACIDCVHISLFIAIFHKWVTQAGSNRIRLDRPNLMEAAKISSTATYFKKIQYLNEKGYIEYFPSFFAKEGSLFGLISE